MISFEIPPDHAANIDKLLDKIGVKGFSCSEIKASLDHHRELQAKGIQAIKHLIDEFKDVTDGSQVTDPSIVKLEGQFAAISNDARYVYLLRKINEELSEGCYLLHDKGRLINKIIGRFKSNLTKRIIEPVEPYWRDEPSEMRGVLRLRDGDLVTLYQEYYSGRKIILGILPNNQISPSFVNFDQNRMDDSSTSVSVYRRTQAQGSDIYELVILQLDKSGGWKLAEGGFLGHPNMKPLPNTPSFKYYPDGRQFWSLGNGTGGCVVTDHLYEGQITDDRVIPHGEGTLVYRPGTPESVSFEGKFEKGELVFGTIRYPKEGRYIGEIANLKPHGKGKFQVDDKTSVEGNFKGGAPHGYVKFINADCILEGEVEGHVLVGKQRLKINVQPPLTIPESEEEWNFTREGRFNALTLNIEGQGKEYDIYGNYYEGMFKDGVRNGFGTQVLSGRGKMQGNFNEKGLQGKGQWYLEGGDIYEGEFVDSIPNGVGSLTRDGKVIAKGVWKNGVIVEPQEGSITFEGKTSQYSGNSSKGAEEKSEKQTRGGASQFTPKGSTDNKLGCSSLSLDWQTVFRAGRSGPLSGNRWPKSMIGMSSTRILIQKTARILFK